MSRSIVAAVAFLILALASPVTRPGYCQRPYSGAYRPSSPTISPWLDMFRDDGGPLPNYYQFVRPKQEILRTFDDQRRQLGRQRAAIGVLGNEMSALGGEMIARPTGIGGSFMNYSHYYPSYQRGRLRR